MKLRLPSGNVETLRLIGLNTPESVDPRRPVECYGRVASVRMKEFLPLGLRVELETDPTEGDRDRYGRLLRVFLPNGWNAAEVMSRQGFGHEYTYRLPYRYQDAFKEAQREAREKGKRGLWARTACGGEATTE